MRALSSISPTATNSNSRQVKSLSATYAVRPVHASEQTVPYVEHRATDSEGAHWVGPSLPEADRRKIRRRANYQAVLAELRSGIDRRRHNLLGMGTPEHIDETV